MRREIKISSNVRLLNLPIPFDLHYITKKDWYSFFKYTSFEELEGLGFTYEHFENTKYFITIPGKFTKFIPLGHEVFYPFFIMPSSSKHLGSIEPFRFFFEKPIILGGKPEALAFLVEKPK